MSNSKKCVVCGETKEVNSTNFFRSKFHDADGYSSTCAACNVKQSHAREAALSAESPLYDPNSKRQARIKARKEMDKKRYEIDTLLEQGLHRCSSCETVKPVSEFHKNSTTYSRYSAVCKECKKISFDVAKANYGQSTLRG
jgi:hypothetical protein